ncbi:hypothetical protein VTO42DRAFT_563 [Malbranchea cinnamomea]
MQRLLRTPCNIMNRIRSNNNGRQGCGFRQSAVVCLSFLTSSITVGPAQPFVKSYQGLDGLKAPKPSRGDHPGSIAILPYSLWRGLSATLICHHVSANIRLRNWCLD